MATEPAVKMELAEPAVKTDLAKPVVKKVLAARPAKKKELAEPAKNEELAEPADEGNKSADDGNEGASAELAEDKELDEDVDEGSMLAERDSKDSEEDGAERAEYEELAKDDGEALGGNGGRGGTPHNCLSWESVAGRHQIENCGKLPVRPQRSLRCRLKSELWMGDSWGAVVPQTPPYLLVPPHVTPSQGGSGGRVGEGGLPLAQTHKSILAFRYPPTRRRHVERFWTF